MDLLWLLKESSHGGRMWEHWEKLLMGFRSSPYIATREMKKVQHRIRGNQLDENNMFSKSDIEVTRR